MRTIKQYNMHVAGSSVTLTLDRHLSTKIEWVVTLAKKDEKPVTKTFQTLPDANAEYTSTLKALGHDGYRMVCVKQEA